MNITVVPTAVPEIDTPLLAVLVPAGDLPASLADLNRSTGSVLQRAFASGDFKGKKDETALLYAAGGKAQRVLLVGLGKSADVKIQSVRRAAAIAARRARSLGTGKVAVTLATEARNGLAARCAGSSKAQPTAPGASRS
jgi:leucyl aminopeptidase